MQQPNKPKHTDNNKSPNTISIIMKLFTPRIFIFIFLYLLIFLLRDLAMSTNKKNDFSTSSLVVSTGCSKKIKSYFSLLRPLPRPKTSPSPDPPSNSNPAPPPPLFFREGEAVVEEYWRRARRLEEELQKLEKLLSEERRVTECNKSTTKEEKKRSVRERELTRLPDGSYVHEIRRLGRPWGRLVMQVSSPTVAENASTAFEVIREMVAMKMEDLCQCLMESMPMKDITGIRASEIVGKTVLSGCEDNYMEAILLNAMDKMEGLVLEGLRIQMSSSRCESNFVARRSKEASSTTTTGDECVVVVVLIQVRDPKEGHGAIGELMIGLIEAKILDVEGKRFSVSGVHVAGLSFTRRMVDGRNFLWSASLQSCRGIESNCCWKYVRNPDRVFAVR